MTEDTKPPNHPMQPIVLVNGVARFRKNAIVDWMLKHGPFDMNMIALKFYADEYKDDRTQFAQLIGYSVSGFGDLSYADRGIMHVADQEVERITGSTKEKPMKPGYQPGYQDGYRQGFAEACDAVADSLGEIKQREST